MLPYEAQHYYDIDITASSTRDMYCTHGHMLLAVFDAHCCCCVAWHKPAVLVSYDTAVCTPQAFRTPNDTPSSSNRYQASQIKTTEKGHMMRMLLPPT